MTTEPAQQEKPRKTLAEARISQFKIEEKERLCLYVKKPDWKAWRSSPLLRADFTTMEFETVNTIYIVGQLVTS